MKFLFSTFTLIAAVLSTQIEARPQPSTHGLVKRAGRTVVNPLTTATSWECGRPPQLTGVQVPASTTPIRVFTSVEINAAVNAGASYYAAGPVKTLAVAKKAYPRHFINKHMHVQEHPPYFPSIPELLGPYMAEFPIMATGLIWQGVGLPGPYRVIFIVVPGTASVTFVGLTWHTMGPGDKTDVIWAGSMIKGKG